MRAPAEITPAVGCFRLFSWFQISKYSLKLLSVAHSVIISVAARDVLLPRWLDQF